MRKIFLLLALFAAIGMQAQERKTYYGRSGLAVKLDLNWGSENYGTIQWQKSADKGATWTDIANQTGTTYNATQSGAESYFRAVITGDPSCPPIYKECVIKPISFDMSVVNQGWNYADVEVSNINLNGAEVVEYGFCASLSLLSRNYTMMPKSKLGDKLTGDKLTLHCDGLAPNQSYSLRFYIKTADGSVVYGPGKLASTLPGIAWESEDWTIETKRLRARFCLQGVDGAAPVIKCYYGKSLDDMKETTVSKVSGNSYRSAYMSSLTPGTTYYIKLVTTIDDEEQVLVKEIKTLTDYSTYTVDETVIPVKHKINWGTPRKLVKISPDNMTAVEYPRVCRIDENTLMFTYHGGTSSDHWLNSYYRMSYDNGKTWGEQVMLFDKSKNILGNGYYRICNPQATVLSNGWIIVSAVGNGAPETNDNCKVICTISKDKGLTWSDPICVGRGRTWEPHVAELPGGELELLVSSEKTWWSGPGGNAGDQEIVFARSTDHGESWSEFKRASHGGGRDGMPVPVVLQGNKGVVFTIESPTGGIPPTMVYRKLTEEWETVSWDKRDDDRRWRTGLNQGSGAPYCVQLPTGELVVSGHTNQVGSVWQTCRPQVCITDNTGHNPKYITLPVTTSNPLKSNEGAYYNSLFVKDAEHIWLLVTRATYNGSTRGNSSIEYIEGTIEEVK